MGACRVLILRFVAGLLASAGLLAAAADKPAPPADTAGQRITALIEQLGDQDYFVRERAQQELAKFSFEAFDALNAATLSNDLEIASRAKLLLVQMQVQWTTKDDPPEVRQFLEDYPVQNAESKIARMRALAALSGDRGIAALCRLVRYEKSPVLSRQAAMQLLDRKPPSKQRAEAIRTHLEGSRQPAAAWLTAYLRLADDPDGAMQEWARLIESEQKLLKASPDRTNRQIIAELIRLQVGWLRARGQDDRATAAMHNLIELEDGRLEGLRRLIDFLIDAKAWPVVDELQAKFSRQFDNNALLLYAFAHAQLLQGKESQANAAAARALRLNPGRNAGELHQHLEIAAELRVRKRVRWAADEFRQVAERNDGDESTLLELMECLTELKSWDEIEKARRQFARRFETSALLRYALAEALAAQGQQSLADETAAAAFRLNPGKDQTSIHLHHEVATSLYEGKRWAWAAREYQYLLQREDLADEVILPLTNCLVETKSWAAIGELAKRYPFRFSGHPLLLYALARAEAEQGNRAKADETAARALKLKSGNDVEGLLDHLKIAYRLQEQGLFDWAEKEYRHVIDAEGTTGDLAISAQTWLAEMWHDQLEDRRAAEILQTLVDRIGRDSPDSRPLGTPSLAVDRTLGQIRSRMYYFFACDAQRNRRPEIEREQLTKAMKIEPVDIDVLIACYRLPDSPAEFREQTLRLIKKSAGDIRETIREEPDESNGYNQFAWLIGNTEGDMEEALRLAQTAVRLRPESGGHLDTLAHVHFARGEYEDAVKTQVKAAELEPHSRLIAEKLKLFRQKLEEQRNRGK
jgi:predicted Zn-dependent protease